MDYIIALIKYLFIKMTQNKTIVNPVTTSSYSGYFSNHSVINRFTSKTFSYGVKVKRNEVETLRTINDLAKTVVAKKGKTLSWLRFAKKNSTGGFSFIPHKEPQWSALEKLAEKISILYPDKRSGEIVDLISELVNTTVSDCLSGAWATDLIKLSSKERKYLHQTLISLVGLETYVPRHEYLYPVKTIDQNNWMVKDLKSGKIMQVTKTIQGNYYFFFIKPTDRKTV